MILSTLPTSPTAMMAVAAMTNGQPAEKSCFSMTRIKRNAMAFRQQCGDPGSKKISGNKPPGLR